MPFYSFNNGGLVLIALDTLRGIKESYPDPEVKTVIGLSNISFGLPEENL